MDWNKEIEKLINRRPGEIKTNKVTLEAPYGGDETVEGLGVPDELSGSGDETENV